MGTSVEVIFGLSLIGFVYLWDGTDIREELRAVIRFFGFMIGWVMN